MGGMPQAGVGAMSGPQLPSTPVRPGTSAPGTAPSTPGIRTSTSGVPASQGVNGVASAPTINGAPALNASSGSQVNVNATNAVGLPPLPAQVQLNQNVTRISVVPIAESREKIPELSKVEIEDIKGWMEKDRAYEKRYKEMVLRSQTELRNGFGGTHQGWFERGAANSRAKERFDLQYPHVPPSRDVGRRRTKKREGLKIPGRLKLADAVRGEQLVPIRLEFDVEHHKYRDTFVWNLNGEFFRIITLILTFRLFFSLLNLDFPAPFPPPFFCGLM